MEKQDNDSRGNKKQGKDRKEANMKGEKGEK